MSRMEARDREEFLRRPRVGGIATLRGDGCPCTVPIWWLWDAHNDAFWLTGTYSFLRCKRLVRDPRMSLCIEASAPPPGHVGVDAVAELREPPGFAIWPLLRRRPRRGTRVGVVQPYPGG